jgi:uncharacterized protein (TIGR00369 family)
LNDPRLAPLNQLNQLIKENRVAEYFSPNLALGMHPTEFAHGVSRWLWREQPASVLNPFGTIQGGYLALLVDEMLSTAIASVLEPNEWAMTVEFKVNFLCVLNPQTLTGEARVIKRGRGIAFMEAQIANQRGVVSVTASSTWKISRQ